MRLIKYIFNSFKSLFHSSYNRFVFWRNGVVYSRCFSVNGILWVDNKGSIIIGRKFRGNSGIDYNPIGGDIKLRLISLQNAKIVIGDNCSISNSTIVSRSSVTIGNNVFIGGGCRIWDNDFHSIHAAERESEFDNGIMVKPIKIGHHVFIGASSIILKGTEIGDFSVIGAGSVVTGKIPPFEIWGGNPAKCIKKIQTQI
jgi:acetyltransferase-like isoleucine patch superfamily enzyme